MVVVRGRAVVAFWLALTKKILVFLLWPVIRLFSGKYRRRNVVEKAMENSTTFAEWKQAAFELDLIDGHEVWKSNPKSASYDYVLIQRRTDVLQALRTEADFDVVANVLRSGMMRDLGGIGRRDLHARCHLGTKRLIENYTHVVSRELNRLARMEGGDESIKFDFFYEARQAFGRSALLLSGGAGFGMYHFGVVKALFEENLLPRVISGSSVGSLVAGIVAVRRDDEMTEIFKPGTLKLNAFEKQKKGNLRRKLARLFKKEAYDRTNRILNITVSSTGSFDPPRLCNHLTCPNVLIWSAACASCALWLLYEPVPLLEKYSNGEIKVYNSCGLEFTDGSVENDLPMKRLSQLFHVNHFIVSQVNPHVLPFLQENRFPRVSGILHRLARTAKLLLKSEIQHRVEQLMILGLVSPAPWLVQHYTGDITIVPRLRWRDYRHLIGNPDEEFRTRCLLEGERSTWPKIGIIKTMMQVEKVLEEAVHFLRLRSSSSIKLSHHLQVLAAGDETSTNLMPVQYQDSFAQLKLLSAAAKKKERAARKALEKTNSIGGEDLLDTKMHASDGNDSTTVSLPKPYYDNIGHPRTLEAIFSANKEEPAS